MSRSKILLENSNIALDEDWILPCPSYSSTSLDPYDDWSNTLGLGRGGVWTATRHIQSINTFDARHLCGHAKCRVESMCDVPNRNTGPSGYVHNASSS